MMNNAGIPVGAVVWKAVRTFLATSAAVQNDDPFPGLVSRCRPLIPLYPLLIAEVCKPLFLQKSGACYELGGAL